MHFDNDLNIDDSTKTKVVSGKKLKKKNHLFVLMNKCFFFLKK